MPHSSFFLLKWWFLPYMLAFVCIIRSFAGTYKQTAFICKETNSIKFIWLMLNLAKSCKLVLNLRHEYFPMPTGLSRTKVKKVQLCFNYNHHCYKVYSWKASWTVLICLFTSPFLHVLLLIVLRKTVSFHYFMFFYVFWYQIENSNSHKFHIGIASFHHKLLVCVLLK